MLLDASLAGRPTMMMAEPDGRTCLADMVAWADTERQAARTVDAPPILRSNGRSNPARSRRNVVFAQGAHAHFTGAGAQDRYGRLFVN